MPSGNIHTWCSILSSNRSYCYMIHQILGDEVRKLSLVYHSSKNMLRAVQKNLMLLEALLFSQYKITKPVRTSFFSKFIAKAWPNQILRRFSVTANPSKLLARNHQLIHSRQRISLIVLSSMFSVYGVTKFKKWRKISGYVSIVTVKVWISRSKVDIATGPGG